MGALQRPQPRQQIVFLAHILFGPLDRDAVIAGEGLHPVLVVGGPLPQDRFIGHGLADHLTEEVDDLFRPRQPTEVAGDDEAVKTVIYQHQQFAEQRGEQFHRNIPEDGTVADFQESCEWDGSRLSADQENNGWRGRASASPRRFVTSSVVPRGTTQGSSPSASCCCFPPKLATLGCWTPPINWPHRSPAMEMPCPSTLRRPTRILPSAGRESTESMALPLSTGTRTPPTSARSLVIQRRESRTKFQICLARSKVEAYIFVRSPPRSHSGLPFEGCVDREDPQH